MDDMTNEGQNKDEGGYSLPLFLPMANTFIVTHRLDLAPITSAIHPVDDKSEPGGVLEKEMQRINFNRIVGTC